MSSLARQIDQDRRRLASERARVAARARRAEAGNVAEMARSLLRDARDASRAEGGCEDRAAAGRERPVAARRSLRRRGASVPLLAPAVMAARRG